MKFSQDTAAFKLSGWSAIGNAEKADEQVTLSLMAGELRLGAIRRDRSRPDVDSYLGYSSRQPGFKIDDFGLFTFSRISGVSGFDVLVNASDGSWARHPLADTQTSALLFQPLGSRKGKAFRLADLWFESHRDLALRFEGGEKSARWLDAYQFLPGVRPQLVDVGTDCRIGASMLSIASFSLLNPLLPVLLIFKREDGSIETVDFIPFPSLARGGMHSAETLLAREGHDELSCISLLSTELLSGLLQRTDSEGGFVSKIEFAPTYEPSGLEPGANEDVLQWLGSYLDIEFGAISSGAYETPEFVQKRLDSWSSKRGLKGPTLQLPLHGIPTISSLVHKLRSEAETTVYGSFAIVDQRRHGPIWSVWLPRSNEWIEELQPTGQSECRPVLLFTADDAVNATESPSPSWPLALLFRPEKGVAQGALPLEVSDELPHPLLPKSDVGGEKCCAIIFPDLEHSSPVPLIESLARQQSPDELTLILTIPPGGDIETLDALSRLFPDRYMIIEEPRVLTRLERLIGVRDRVTTNSVLLFESGAVLPDTRTVAVLLAMLRTHGVLTSGCLIRDVDEFGSPSGAGYSISGLNLKGRPNLTFDVIDPNVFCGPTVYPVIANPLVGMAIRRDLLMQVEASGSSSVAVEVDDLLVGLSAIKNGGRNICTTSISIYSHRNRRGLRSQGISVPYQLRPEDLIQLAEAAAVVQRIR